MDFNYYQHFAGKVRNSDVSLREERLNYALGLGGESGELQDIIKKHLFHGHYETETTDQIIEELGDILWYLSQIASLYGIAFDTVAQKNLAKVRKRYPKGFLKRATLRKGSRVSGVR